MASPNPDRPDRPPQQPADAPPAQTDSPNRTAPPAEAPSYRAALQTIRPGDFLALPQMPCARTALMTGIGAGVALGGVRAALGRRTGAVLNAWAFGFALGSGGMFAFCQRQRTIERRNMERVADAVEAKRRRMREEALRAREGKGKKEDEGTKGGSWWGWGGGGEKKG